MQSTTWANKLFNSLSIEEQTNINNTHQLNTLTKLEQTHQSDQDKRQLIYQRWQRTFKRKHGEYWPFYVEKTCYDFPKAQQLRLDPFIRRTFLDHLQDKHGHRWLWKTAETNDDCELLHQMRCDYYDEEERIHKKMEQDAIDQEKIIEDAKNHMKAQVWQKHITQHEYDDWLLLFNATKDYGYEIDDWRQYFSGKYRHIAEGERDYWRHDTWRQDLKEPEPETEPDLEEQDLDYRPCSCCYDPFYN